MLILILITWDVTGNTARVTPVRFSTLSDVSTIIASMKRE
jgi:hypothetical protein